MASCEIGGFIVRCFTPGSQTKKLSPARSCFFDLIFVAAIIQLGDALSKHVTQTHATLGPLAVFVALFIPLWIAWTGYTFFANRFALDDVGHRLLVFLEMFAIGAMAISATSVVFEGDHTTFSLAYAVAQGIGAACSASAR